MRFGEFTFDGGSQLLSRDGGEIALPPRSAVVLAHLLARAGKVVSKHELVDVVWGGRFVSDAAVAEAISQLRQALDDDTRAPRFIQTLHRRGYRFIAAVEVLSDPTAAEGFEPTPIALAPPVVETRRNLRLAVPAALALTAGALGVWLAVQPPADDSPASWATPGARFDLTVPAEVTGLGAIALAPDGETLAFAGGDGSSSRLYLRRLQAPEIRPIPGSERGRFPFFSPDGKRIAYFAQGRLVIRQVEEGGAALEVAEVRRPTGGSWGADGTIVFTTNLPGELWLIPATGGAARRIARLPEDQADWGIESPSFLPDGRQVVAAVLRTSVADASIVAFDIESGESTELVSGARHPAVVEDRLCYARADGLYCARFADNRRVGEELRLQEAVNVVPTLGVENFGWARNGTLAYLVAPPPPVVEVRWVGSADEDRLLMQRPDILMRLRLSPSREQAVVATLEGGSHLWLWDLSSGSRIRLTHEGFNVNPIWTADGEEVCFSSPRRGAAYDIYCQPIQGSPEATPSGPLIESPRNKLPYSWSPDGDWLIYSEADPVNGLDLWAYSAREHTSRRLFGGPADEEGGVVSPDGRWIIFRSSENGEREVFVDSFPEPKRRLQVSQGRSLELSWGDSGRSIVFLQGSKVSRVPFDPQAGRVAGPSRVVYESPAILAVQADPTTERVLVARRAPGSEKPPVLRVVLPAG